MNELTPNLADDATVEIKRRLQNDNFPLDNLPELRIERQKLKATPIIQALGGVAVKHNTVGTKYFKNIRSCGAVHSNDLGRGKKNNNARL